MKQFTISNKEAGQRMDKYLFKVLDQAPKGFVYKMIRKKNIVLNDKKASGQEILSEEDEIKIYLADDTFEKFASKLEGSESRPSSTKQKNCYKIQIIYENDDILVMNKPAGILSQKAASGDYSANDWLIDYLLQSGQISQNELRTFRPSICNRLDRNTSGILIAGKTIHGLQDMAKLLQDRSVKKYYHTLVIGSVTKPKYLTGYLVKNHQTNQVEIRSEGQGDYIETSYKPIAQIGNGTLLEVHLITGRSHQIRAHLASVSHPILGDPKYGDPKLNEQLRKATHINRQLLHACRMEFPDGRVLTAKVPDDFHKAEAWLKK